MTTNVPLPVFGPTGFKAPSEADILTGVTLDNNAAFGGNLNPSLKTPQGQLATSLTAIIGDCNDTFLAICNGVDPAYASGRMQDAIGRIYFFERNPAVPTTVVCRCTGLAGTVIPAGAKAIDAAGVSYVSAVGVIIPATGYVDVIFTCTSTGPINCPANTLTKIYRAIPGWDSINNVGNGVVGADVESRTAFEYRRKLSVALNAHGSLDSVRAAVFTLPNVIDVYAYENNTSVDIQVGSTNVTVVAHSLYIAVVGGASADIANAIYMKKDLGCNTNGSTIVFVTDSNGFSTPYPTYTIRYQVPTPMPVLFSVTIGNDPSLPANIVALVQAAIVAAFNGADGGRRATIGSTIFASRYYAPVASASFAVAVVSILIGTSTPIFNSVQIGIDRSPTVVPANISVTLV